jgi:RNA polymerase sigma factor (sigma-70 family)
VRRRRAPIFPKKAKKQEACLSGVSLSIGVRLVLESDRMLIHPPQSSLERVCPSLRSAPAGGVTDADLLERFVTNQDEAAFELLVWRHGPLVLGTCRRVLGNAHDAEDAFQATFFALARKAGSIGCRESVSGWLYKVAYRVALRARTTQARRQREGPLHEEPAAPTTLEPAELLAWRELQPVLDAQIDRLPEKYRTVFILCYLEGKTNEEAARELGCPKGTVLSRLSRARDHLRKWLGQRGVALAAAPLALLSEQAHRLLEVSPVLVHATVHLAILAPVGRLAAGLAQSPAVELAESVLRDLQLTYWRRVGSLVALLILLAGGLAVSASSLLSAGPPEQPSGQPSSCHSAP